MIKCFSQSFRNQLISFSNPLGINSIQIQVLEKSFGIQSNSLPGPLEIHWESIGNSLNSLLNSLEINELLHLTLQKSIGNLLQIDEISWPTLYKSMSFLSKSCTNPLGSYWKMIEFLGQPFRNQLSCLPSPSEMNWEINCSVPYQILQKSIGNLLDIDQISWPTLQKSIKLLFKSFTNQLGIHGKLIKFLGQPFRN